MICSYVFLFFLLFEIQEINAWPRTPVGSFLLSAFRCSLSRIVEQVSLQTMRHAKGAAYNHQGRRGCLEGTRVTLLDDIGKWTKDWTRPPVFWLDGLARTGKSAIARTVAERCDAVGDLGASFFFPGASDDEHGSIFPTLAFDLACKHPKFRSALLRRLRSDPETSYESLAVQAEKLFTEPLMMTVDDPMVIVIDGLGECSSPAEIILELEGIVDELLTVKFFVTGRPEPGIKRQLSRLGCTAECHSLYNATQDTVDEDIRIFLRHELSGIAANRGLDGWPTTAQLDLLRDKATPLFAYAVAIVKCFDKALSSPSTIYTRIMDSGHDTSYVGAVQGVHKGMSLDSLCISILEASCADLDEEDTALARSVLAAALSTPPPSPMTILEMAKPQPGGEPMDEEVVTRTLESFYSLLYLPEDRDRPVRPFHELLSHCLADRERCSDARFLIQTTEALIYGLPWWSCTSS